jgi:hypothetical protein
MGLSLRNESVLVFVYAVVVLLVLTRSIRLLNTNTFQKPVLYVLYFKDYKVHLYQYVAIIIGVPVRYD